MNGDGKRGWVFEPGGSERRGLEWRGTEAECCEIWPRMTGWLLNSVLKKLLLS